MQRSRPVLWQEKGRNFVATPAVQGWNFCHCTYPNKSASSTATKRPLSPVFQGSVLTVIRSNIWLRATFRDQFLTCRPLLLRTLDWLHIGELLRLRAVSQIFCDGADAILVARKYLACSVMELSADIYDGLRFSKELGSSERWAAVALPPGAIVPCVNADEVLYQAKQWTPAHQTPQGIASRSYIPRFESSDPIFLQSTEIQELEDDWSVLPPTFEDRRRSVAHAFQALWKQSEVQWNDDVIVGKSLGPVLLRARHIFLRAAAILLQAALRQPTARPSVLDATDGLKKRTPDSLFFRFAAAISSCAFEEGQLVINEATSDQIPLDFKVLGAIAFQLRQLPDEVLQYTAKYSFGRDQQRTHGKTLVYLFVWLLHLVEFHEVYRRRANGATKKLVLDSTSGSGQLQKHRRWQQQNELHIAERKDEDQSKNEEHEK